MSGDALPDPLTPAGCDMGRNDWYPLHFDRLRNSRWWRRASDMCRARNVMLWGEAYKAVPAGSLEDNDDDLAEAAGFGFDVDAFLAVKAEIMAPWVMCSDGRWYHPTLCEVVLDAWSRVSEKRKSERERKQAQRMAVRSKTAGVPLKSAHVPRDKADVPRDIEEVPRDTPRFPAGHIAQDRTGQDRRLGTDVPVAKATVETPSAVKPWDHDKLFSQLWEAADPRARRRAKSKAKVWPAWVKAQKVDTAERIVCGFLAYMAGDPDVKRTGGPGLHIWLNDRTWETWVSDGDDGELGSTWSEARWTAAVGIWRETKRWEPRLGPEPGSPGCRVPSQLLITTTDRRTA